MTRFRVVAIPSPTADAVRATLKSPRYGHPAHPEIAAGYGPCRHCLRTLYGTRAGCYDLRVEREDARRE